MDTLLHAKEKSGKTFSQIGRECGLTNLYTAAMFYNQQQLKPATADALARAVPALSPGLVDEMQKAPARRYVRVCDPGKSVSDARLFSGVHAPTPAPCPFSHTPFNGWWIHPDLVGPAGMIRI